MRIFTRAPLITDAELTQVQKDAIAKVKAWADANAAQWVLDNLADSRISNNYALGLAKRLWG